MILGKKVVVVMPAYRAAATLERTWAELPHEIVDAVVVVDDGSDDETAAIARRLGARTLRHDANRGYGANQKSCYAAALALGADIVVMVHPDYQYSPRLCGAMAWMIASDEYDLVLGSRILGEGALRGGMPLWRYVANRALTLVENLLLGVKLSEFHTGYRSYARRVLEALPLDRDSDDFLFDNQVLAQAVHFGFRIGEISCPARYRPDSSSIGFLAACRYGCGVLGTALAFRLQRLGAARFRIFPPPDPPG
jgi:glycosyltransferase involved in cell wall biosynthesis